MGIQTLIPRLPEMGKIKIGGKGEERQGRTGTYRIPVSWDYILVTTLDRDGKGDFVVDEDLTKKLSQGLNKDKRPTIIGPAIFVFNEIELNFFTSFAYYTKSKRLCGGNGKVARRLIEEDPEKPDYQEIVCDPEKCKFAQDNKCKPNGILSVLFPDCGTLGGVHKFRTTSWNSIISLMGQLRMFHTLTGGKLAGIKFFLKLNSKEVMVKGSKKTIHFLTLEYRGTWEQLMIDSRSFERPALEAEAQAAGELMLDNEVTLEDPEEFAPEHDIDETTGTIVDKEGNAIDQIQEDPEEEPPAEDNPFDNTGDERRSSYLKNIYEPLSQDFLEIRSDCFDKAKTSREAPKVVSLEEIIQSVNDKAKLPDDLSLEELKKVTSRIQEGYEDLLSWKDKRKKKPNGKRSTKSETMFQE